MSSMNIIPEFKTTDANDFEVLIDVIDTRLSIICHKTTGYFNITKIAKLVHTLKVQDNKDNDKHIAEKRTRDWFKDNNIDELISVCCEYENVDKVHYKLRDGTPKKYIGIYVSELLYHQFMQWLDKIYALKVSVLLKKHREETTARMIAEKNAEIVGLCDTILQHQETIDSMYDCFEINLSDNSDNEEDK